MTKATAILFTSMTCPHCPVAKKIFEEVKASRIDAAMHVVQMHTEQGQTLAQEFGVRSVPTTIFYGDGHQAPMGLVGAQTAEVLEKYIDIAVGKRVFDEQKKEFSLRNLFKRKE